MSKSLYSSDSFGLTQRKTDHIELTHKSKTAAATVDQRFNYEPMFFSHPDSHDKWEQKFLGFDFDYPIWISSMTGGSEKSKKINQNLAKLCGEFNLGMGLGSCRAILTNQDRIEDFTVRKFMGNQPLFANIGFAQVEELANTNSLSEMIKRLEADGLIIHINPLQEWFQQGGDRFKTNPLDTLKKFANDFRLPIIIKEVGQGLGPKSLKALLDLPISAIEFGAYGGTNFSMLESLRTEETATYKQPFINVGHTANEMVEILNALPNRNKEFIISGGIKNVLDGYELKSKLKAPSVIGMASLFLAPAQEDYEHLRDHFLQIRESLLVAKRILTIKEDQ